ncbi:hypothetical protein B0H14DRAFT_3623826 [Mycena olivaceomarginata]|nr:hypothetical protein B0H14DRAFT_3623826 [Mycena olivaceomarginata]
MFDFASLSSPVVHLVLATLYLFVVPAVARHLANASYPSLPAFATVHTHSSSEHGLTPSHSVARGVGDPTTNQMTLHTSGGCSLDTAVTSQFTGTPTAHLSCATSGDDNDGCGITFFAADVYGHSFNLIGLRNILDTSRLF